MLFFFPSWEGAKGLCARKVYLNPRMRRSNSQNRYKPIGARNSYHPISSMNPEILTWSGHLHAKESNDALRCLGVWPHGCAHFVTVHGTGTVSDLLLANACLAQRLSAGPGHGGSCVPPTRVGGTRKSALVGPCACVGRFPRGTALFLLDELR